MNYIAVYLIPKWRLLPGWSLFAGTVLIALLSTGSASGFDITDTSVTVRWTATGDDGYLGRASYYDLRIDTVRLDAGNWHSADSIPGLSRPNMSGTRESFTIYGLLPSTTYDILIRIGDEVPHWSGISNVLTVTTLPRLVVTTPDPEENTRPVEFRVNQNYPNPFNPATTISYEIGRSHPVRIEVFNIQGRTVNLLNDRQMPAGEHSVIWDGRDLSGNPVASGIYFYRIRAGEYVETHKMILLR